jgi:S-adenosylmethionine:tRNA ribosyltransferase-isomerase
VNRTPDPLPTAAFDYPLPRHLIALRPADRRDASRLLVLDRTSGAIEHHHFRDIGAFLDPGDILVLNETRVFPGRLTGRKPTGARAEVLLLEPVDGDFASATWRALVRPGSKLRPGSTVIITPDLEIEILEAADDGSRIVRLRASLPIEQAIERFGQVPLPPYIDRAPDAEDRERYQTVYARTTGSIAAPTAGLHFTTGLLAELVDRGVEIARIVLHVGPGTFRPVEEEDPSCHPMHAETYEVTEDAIRAIEAGRERGKRIWAVGTTVVRALESAVDAEGRLRPGRAQTRLFIRPPCEFRVVDGVITNFHLPRSTLLMLVAAFAGHPAVMHAYAEAIRLGYRFYSYGDAMAIVSRGRTPSQRDPG